jgi:hypothetical protein
MRRDTFLKERRGGGSLWRRRQNVCEKECLDHHQSSVVCSSS